MFLTDFPIIAFLSFKGITESEITVIIEWKKSRACNCRNSIVHYPKTFCKSQNTIASLCFHGQKLAKK